MFSWEVACYGEDPGNLVVSFSSNPVLGLNEAAIESQLGNAFVFNPADGSFGVRSDTVAVEISATIPMDLAQMNFHFDTEAHVGVVPEPSVAAYTLFTFVAVAGGAGLFRLRSLKLVSELGIR